MNTFLRKANITHARPKRVWANPGNISEWWRNRVSRRLCEREERAVFSFEDAKERLRVYTNKWAETKEVLRVFYYKGTKQGHKDAWDDVPAGAEIQVLEVDDGSYINEKGIVPHGLIDPREYVWANTIVQVKLAQLTYSSDRTVLPKAATAQYGEARGYCGILELLYALEPEGFEVIENYKSVSEAPYGRPFTGKYVGYYVTEERLRAGDTIRKDLFHKSKLLRGIFEQMRKEHYPGFPSFSEGVHVFSSREAAQEWKKKERGDIYVVEMSGKMSRHDLQVLLDYFKGFANLRYDDFENDLGPQEEVRKLREEYWEGVRYGKLEAVLVDGSVKVIGRMD